MRAKKAAVQIFVGLFLLCFSTADAWALIAFDQNYNFNFRFNNPGARANAMGGAFIGLADDATAAYTNPAGLTILTEPEISVEYKTAAYENTQYGPTGTAYDFDEEGKGLSFVSLAFPMKKATFTAYRHQLLKITNDYALAPLQYITETDIEAVTYGIGAGLQLTDRLSLGVSVGFAQLDYYYTSEMFQDPSLSYLPLIKYVVDNEDYAEQYTVSLLWNPFGELSIGLVYRKGPEFKTTFETLFDMRPNNGLFETLQSAKNTLKVPDVYGIGVSYRLPFGLTVAADVNQVEYSDILKDFVFQNGRTQYGGLRASDYTVDDRTEIHIGFEYVLDFGEIPFAVRGGYYHKPEHRIRYEGPDIQQQNIAQEGEDDHIFSFGIGAIFFGNVQLDGAASIGDFEQEYTVSFVYRID